MKTTVSALLACAILASFSFTACSSGSDDAQKTVSIADVGFSIANRPLDWYPASATAKPNLVYDFTLALEGNMSAADISSARVYLPNDSGYYWYFNPADDFDAATKRIYGSFRYGGRTVGGLLEAGSGVELPIGMMKAEVKLTNGVASTYSFLMGVPGSTTTNGKSFVYAPDGAYSAAEPSVSASAMGRPTVTSFTGGGPDPLVVTFSLLGSNAHNGWVWFYDGSGAFVGELYPFRARSDGTVTPAMGGGAFNVTTGASNTLTISAANITYNGAPASSSQVSSIQDCRVVVCDGAQYEAADRWTWYDYKAISARAVLVPN
jgi:hypothetical protein